jgi:hypothetical protein
MTDNKQLRTATWNGSSFGSSVVLAQSSADKKYENFMVATSAGGAQRLISWMEVKP